MWKHRRLGFDGRRHFHNQLLWHGAAFVVDKVADVAHTLGFGRVCACDGEQWVDQMARRIELSLFCSHYRATRHHVTPAGRASHLWSQASRKTQRDADEGTEGSGSHMIVCVTDHCNLAFSNKCTFVGTKNNNKKTPKNQKEKRLGENTKCLRRVLWTALRFLTVFCGTVKRSKVNSGGHCLLLPIHDLTTHVANEMLHVGIYILPGRERETLLPTVAYWSVLRLLPFHTANIWTPLGRSSSEHSDPSSDLPWVILLIWKPPPPSCKALAGQCFSPSSTPCPLEGNVEARSQLGPWWGC